MIPNSIGYSFAVMMPGSNYPSVLSHSLPPKSLKQSESEKKTFATGKKKFASFLNMKKQSLKRIHQLVV